MHRGPNISIVQGLGGRVRYFYNTRIRRKCSIKINPLAVFKYIPVISLKTPAFTQGCPELDAGCSCYEVVGAFVCSYTSLEDGCDVELEGLLAVDS